MLQKPLNCEDISVISKPRKALLRAYRKQDENRHYDGLLHNKWGCKRKALVLVSLRLKQAEYPSEFGNKVVLSSCGSVVHFDEYDGKEYHISENDQDDGNASPLQCDDLSNPPIRGPCGNGFDTAMVRR